MVDSWCAGLHSSQYEPVAQLATLQPHFDFDRRKLGMEEVRELLYWETLEYHPQVRPADHMIAPHMTR